MLPELLRHLVTPLLDNPEKAKIDHIDTENTDIFLLSVAEEDRGHILGKDGKTADSIRTMMNRVGEHYERDIVLDILD